MTSRIKVMAELNIVERRRPQDGQFGINVDGHEVDFRISFLPTYHGEKVVMRVLDKSNLTLDLDKLGFEAQPMEAFTDALKLPFGMILLTGPTGSGKTTTLYSALHKINKSSHNIVTVEDPVEYELPGVNQVPTKSEIGLTFAAALRSILRQDPDIVMVGEIRDEETARIAMQAALTGHFVLSSLHSVDAVSAVHRFTDMGIEPFLVASAMSGVVGQRLLRRNCAACSETYKPSASESRMLERFSDLTPVWTKGTGCELCSGTGYRGRVGVYELLVFTDTIRDLVVARASHHEIKAVAMEEGMRTMQQEAFDLVAKGMTTVEDVLRSVYASGMDSEAAPIGELAAGKSELPKGKEAIESADGDEGLPEGASPGDDSLRDATGSSVVDDGGAIPTGPSTMTASVSGEGER